ncbi:MAG: cupin [Cellvibrionales bacterium]|nr:cupin [Cellvibrionales bacterium]
MKTANTKLRQNKLENTVNVFTALPKALPEEVFTPILTGKNVRIERILSYGQTTPEGEWYDQDENEWVLLLQGNAKLLIKNKGEFNLTAGDNMLLPAHEKHRVTWTDPGQITIWLAIFYSE